MLSLVGKLLGLVIKTSDIRNSSFKPKMAHRVKIYLFFIVGTEVMLLIESFGISKEMAAMECKAKFRVPRNDIDNLKNRQLPETKEGKCMMACILKKLNVINKEGKFEVRTVKRWLDDKYKGDRAKLVKAYARADSCADHLPVVDDECEYAAKILECTKKPKKIKN